MLDNENINEIINTVYISNSKPFYTLSECLNNLNENTINVMYNVYEKVIKTVKGKEKSKEEKIKKLNKEIIKNFKEYLMTIPNDDLNIIKEYLENNKSSKNSITLLSCGFMFSYSCNDEIINIIPNELIKIYKETYTEDFIFEKDIENVKKYFTIYGLAYGIVEKDKFIKIIRDYYNINLKEKIIDDCIREVCCCIFKNKYYSMLSEDNNEFIDDLLKIREENNALDKIFTVSEMDTYFDMIDYWISNLEEIFKKNKKGKVDEFSVLLKIFSISFDDPLDILDYIVDDFDLSEEELDKLLEFITDNIDDFRFWDLNGNTLIEHEMSDFLIKKIPNKKDLKSLLNSLDKDTLDILYDRYDVSNIISLREEIIEYFKVYLEQVDNEELFILGNNHEKKYTMYTNYELIESGNIFIYQTEFGSKVIIPDEMMELLDKKLDEINNNLNPSKNANDYVHIYLTANGFIKREKLKELLFNHHNIDISLDKLDKIIKREGYFILDDWYILVSDFRREDIKDISNFKNVDGEYKICDYDTLLPENNMISELKEFCYKNNINDIDKIVELVISGIKLCLLDEKSLKGNFDDNGIKINSLVFKQMYSIIKKYKNDIGTWSYNGYSINDINEMKKKLKIGRNAPCPCGSGKKYKMCCGK